MTGAGDAADVVVVGGGFAGAATAYFLARSSSRPAVCLLEAEAQPGVHSSGRNAALVRGPCGVSGPDELSIEGARFLAALPEDFPTDPGVRLVGSYFVDREERLQARCVAGAELVSIDVLREAVPCFRPRPRHAAVWTPADGVLDIEALLEGYLEGARRAGASIRTGEEVLDIEVRRGRVQGVRTSAGRVACANVVIAAGAWAQRLGETAGVHRRMRPTRRHLLQTEPDPRVAPGAAYLWDLERGFYFRPSEGGLLLCACDEDDSEPGDCPTEPRLEAVIRERVREALPEFANFVTRRLWSGHRTFSTDPTGRLGADEERSGLFWAAGLGGHGMTASAAVGRRVAAEVLSA